MEVLVEVGGERQDRRGRRMGMRGGALGLGNCLLRGDQFCGTERKAEGGKQH